MRSHPSFADHDDDDEAKSILLPARMIPKSGCRFSAKDHAQKREAERRKAHCPTNIRAADKFTQPA
jgi:hypothetical protein